MKTITIEAQESLESIRNNFKEAFPLLDIKFFKKSHENLEGNLSSQEIKDYSKTLSEVADNSENTSISVDGHKKVSTLESDFEKIGLHAQVFRKSGKVYLQTTTTDNLTLADQMRKAHN